MPLLLINRSHTEPVTPALTPPPEADIPCRGRTPTVLPLEAVARLEQSPSVTSSRRNFHLVSMATARLKSHFHAPHAPRLFRSNSTQVFCEVPVDEAGRQAERNFICCYQCHTPNESNTNSRASVNGSSSSQKDSLPLNSAQSREVGSASKNLRVGDFQLLKTIGTGTFARVWLACLADSPQTERKVFALKILRKTDVIRLKQVEHIKNERNTLAAVAGHPFITTMITSFSDRDCLYMLLDYCPGGEVFTYLRRATHFDENTARFYIAEMVLILEFLHERQNIAYRDMKPENMLIDADGHLKLVDFGFAKKICRETYTLCGTPEYLAPEVIRNTGHGIAVDWWSLGILLYEFLIGQPPFWDSSPLKIYEKIVEGRIKYPSALSKDARDLICCLCTSNPAARLGNISQGDLSGAALVKAHPFFKEIDWGKLYRREMKGPIIPRVKGPADSSNFTDYEPPPGSCAPYTKDLQSKYESDFKDF